MKKQYEAPKLQVHGTVAELTGIEGDPRQTDFIYMSSTVLDCTGTGSIDGIVVPLRK